MRVPSRAAKQGAAAGLIAMLTVSGLVAGGPWTTRAEAVPVNTIFTCVLNYAVVQAAPNGYVIGNCLFGVHIHRQKKFAAADLTDWDGGKIFGHFSGCGWINADYDNATTSASSPACDSTSIGYALGEYAAFTNDSAAGSSAINPASPSGASTYRADCYATPGSTTDCRDGTSVIVVQTCPFWANYRPWLPSQAPVDLITNSARPTGVIPVGARVRWRYVAKFPSDTNESYVMVRDLAAGSAADGLGNWGFIKSSCLPNPLPYATVVP